MQSGLAGVFLIIALAFYIEAMLCRLSASAFPIITLRCVICPSPGRIIENPHMVPCKPSQITYYSCLISNQYKLLRAARFSYSLRFSFHFDDSIWRDMLHVPTYMAVLSIRGGVGCHSHFRD